MDEALRAVWKELPRIVADLRAVQARLRTMIAVLPGPVEEEETDLDEMDLPTEIRSVVACVLQDSLGPDLRDLQTVADLLAARKDPGPSTE